MLALAFHFNLSNLQGSNFRLFTASAFFVDEKEGGKVDSLFSIDSSHPARLSIPKIHIDAAVDYVGLAPDGAMEAPKGASNVAWYMLGQKPGEIGSSVISGHSGLKNDIPAVFDDLHKLKKGDKIYVEDGKGIITTFVVRELRTYKLTDDASSVFFSSDGKAHLNLTTCVGVWDEILETHSDRLVVFTDKE